MATKDPALKADGKDPVYTLAQRDVETKDPALSVATKDPALKADGKDPVYTLAQRDPAPKPATKDPVYTAQRDVESIKDPVA